jgi:hypothetical protein
LSSFFRVTAQKSAAELSAAANKQQKTEILRGEAFASSFAKPMVPYSPANIEQSKPEQPYPLYGSREKVDFFHRFLPPSNNFLTLYIIHYLHVIVKLFSPL